MTFYSNSNERLRIDSSGKLLVGTTAAGSSGVDNLVLYRNGNGGITIRNNANQNGNLYFSRGTSGTDEYKGYIQYQHAQDVMVFGTAHTERVRIDSSGNVTISTGNLTIPDSIIHSGDTDTKIAFGTNEIDLQAAGSSRFKVTQYANYVQTGLPLAFLASSGASPNIKSGGSNNQDLLLTTGTGNPTRIQITSGGNVCLLYTSPSPRDS